MVVQKLHEIAPEFQPNQVIADFEEAPAAALRAVYGNDLTVSGCWFHYGQAIMKRLKKIGLTEAYHNEETTQVVFRSLLALPLLPVTDIDPAFQDVKVLVHDDTPSKTLLLQLCRYVERQWLNKSSIGAARMSVRGNPARTNNAVESFHSALRRRVKVAHPNLYTFLGHLQRATGDSESDIARLNRGMSIRRCKKSTNLVNDARIKSCISCYDSGAHGAIKCGAYTRCNFCAL